MKRLSEGQIQQFQKATEDVLENVGFHVMHEKLLRRCRAAGAKVDEASGIVRIPGPLLRELLAQVPSQYQIAGINGDGVTIGGDQQHCLAIVTDPWIVDYETQLPRRPCLEDLRRHTIIAQKLESVVAISRMDFPVTDVEGPTSSLRALEVHLLHHAKHNCVLATSMESLEQWLQIAGILTQGRDLCESRLISAGVAVLSPLALTGANGDLLLTACAHNFPVMPTVCPMAGTTAPYSRAGTLLLGNAEALFVAALSQIVRPGSPFLYGVGASRTDMQSGGDMYYTLDKVLWKLAAAQMGRSYNMPVASECGGTMTYRYDQQNGAEGMLFMLASYESRAQSLAGIGSCYNAVGMSAEMMVIQSAWLEAAKFLNQGIDTDNLDSMVDCIKRAGPGGHYLTDDLTIEMLRTPEFFSNDLLDYSGTYGPYPSLLERAHNKVEAMVADFESPVPEKVQEDLRGYFHDEYVRLER
jgi:trimethylamine--corrinoid protein Co-methyltransferase